jgi:signal transduction histidine kinase/CheY-like chemotaxis protein/HPt (histidine-containing phosphotransfer) domain-containing protein
MANIMIGAVVVYIAGMVDLLDVLFFHYSLNLFRYSSFVFHTGIAFTLSGRLNELYSRLENSNATLEAAVHERTLELEKQTSIALEASRAKSEFLATMSHEIRTPMNAILGISEITMRTSGLPEIVYANIEKVRASGSSLLGIINDILDLSKIESGKLSIDPHDYELPSLINDVVQMNMVRIGSKDIRFTLDADAGLPRRLRGDELRVKQVLNNILSNAFKYTEKGFVRMSVFHKPAVNPAEKDITLVFKIADSGQGMKEEDVEKLFDEYSRFNADANRAVEGTGLGMSITGKLVSMMGGTIEVKSEYRRGSVFTVSLPQEKIGRAVMGEETALKLENFELPAGQNERTDITREYMPYGSVLVVDDLETNLYVASGLMSPYGLAIDTAGGGEEALEKVRTGKSYDVIFMDHMMPGMDGIETTRKIRDLGYRGTIVALTANAISGQAERFLSSGFDGFISKPIDTRQLDAALRKWVKDKHQEGGSLPPGSSPASRVFLHPPQQGDPPPASVPGPKAYDIPGLDTARGIALTGGSAALYRKVLAAFRKDAEERLPLLREIPGPETLPLFTTYVHALKSALASIGAAGLSVEAAKLEAAGKAGDLGLIGETLPGFVRPLGELAQGIRAALGQEGPDAPAGDSASDPAAADCYPLLTQLAEALKAQDTAAIDRILEELEQSAAGPRLREALEKISDDVLIAEFDAAAGTVENLLEEISRNHDGS